MTAPLSRSMLGCVRSLRLSITLPVSVVTKRAFLPKHVRPTLTAIARRKKLQGNTAPAPRSSYLEWNYPAELYAFTARLGETVDEELVREALTERSYLLQQRRERERLGLHELAEGEQAADNQRLAAAGRRLLRDYVSGWLRAALPRLPEDGVQAITDHLTSEAQLAELAAGIGMKDIILSEEYPPSVETHSRCFVAFFGALAESAGETRAQRFARDLVLARLVGADLNAIWHVERPLEQLAGVLARTSGGPPEPRVLRSAGPGSLLAAYVVGIYSDRRLIGEAPGDSVQEAVSLAARDALNRLVGLTDRSRPLDIRADLIPVQTPAPNLAHWTAAAS